MKNTAHAIKPPHLYKTALAVMAAGKLSLWSTAAPIFSSWIPAVLVGVPVFVAGAKLAMTSKSTFKKTATPMMGGPSQDSPLHTSGTFACTRNPMYLGISIALVGAAVATNCVWHLTLPLANIIIMDRYYIPIEERQLQGKFGVEYEKYKAKVGRWI